MSLQDGLPTAAQIKYATDLIGKLGYDLEDYNFEQMTCQQVAWLIRELKHEWEG